MNHRSILPRTAEQMTDVWAYKNVSILDDSGTFTVKLCYIPKEKVWSCRDHKYDPNHPQTRKIKSFYNFHWVVDPFLESCPLAISKAFYKSNTFYPPTPCVTNLCLYLNEMVQDQQQVIIPDFINLLDRYHF